MKIRFKKVCSFHTKFANGVDWLNQYLQRFTASCDWLMLLFKFRIMGSCVSFRKPIRTTTISENQGNLQLFGQDAWKRLGNVVSPKLSL